MLAGIALISSLINSFDTPTGNSDLGGLELALDCLLSPALDIGKAFLSIWAKKKNEWLALLLSNQTQEIS
jgi:hypothetical protein